MLSKSQLRPRPLLSGTGAVWLMGRMVGSDLGEPVDGFDWGGVMPEHAAAARHRLMDRAATGCVASQPDPGVPGHWGTLHREASRLSGGCFPVVWLPYLIRSRGLLRGCPPRGTLLCFPAFDVSVAIEVVIPILKRIFAIGSCGKENSALHQGQFLPVAGQIKPDFFQVRSGREGDSSEQVRGCLAMSFRSPKLFLGALMAVYEFFILVKVSAGFVTPPTLPRHNFHLNEIISANPVDER